MNCAIHIVNHTILTILNRVMQMCVFCVCFIHTCRYFRCREVYHIPWQIHTKTSYQNGKQIVAFLVANTKATFSCSGKKRWKECIDGDYSVAITRLVPLASTRTISRLRVVTWNHVKVQEKRSLWHNINMSCDVFAWYYKSQLIANFTAWVA